MGAKENLLKLIGLGTDEGETTLEKSRPAPKVAPKMAVGTSADEDEDEDNDDDGQDGEDQPTVGDEGVPSQEDREKAAAPTPAEAEAHQIAMSGDDAKASDSDEDGDPNQVTDGDQGTYERATNPTLHGGDTDPDHAHPNAAPMTDAQQKAMPIPQPSLKAKGQKDKPGLRKSMGEASDDEVQDEVLRRSQENPDFFKSLLDHPKADQIMEAIDMSEVVALIVHHAAEREAELRGEVATLTKSLDTATARAAAAEETEEVILKSLEYLVSGHQTLVKSLGDEAGAALTKSRSETSTGVAITRVPERVEPGVVAPTAPGDIPQNLDKGRVSRALLKSMRADEGGIDRDEGTKLMGQLDTHGVEDVYKRLPEGVKALIK